MFVKIYVCSPNCQVLRFWVFVCILPSLCCGFLLLFQVDFLIPQRDLKIFFLVIVGMYCSTYMHVIN